MPSKTTKDDIISENKLDYKFKQQKSLSIQTNTHNISNSLQKDDVISENKPYCKVKQLKTPENQTSTHHLSNFPTIRASKRVISKTAATKMKLIMEDKFYKSQIKK